jgi:lipopolysaccharide export system protein LptC
MAKWTHQHGQISGWLSSSLPLILTIALASSSYWLAWLSSLQTWSDTPKGSRTTPDYFVEDFTWKRLLDNGSKRTQLEGKRIEHIQNDDLLRLDKPRLENESKNGATLTATSDTGSYNNLTGMLFLLNNVIVQRTPAKGEALTVKSPQLTVDTDNQVAIAEQGAQAWRGQNSTLSSENLRIDNLEGTLEANKRVLLSIGGKNAAAQTTDRPNIQP